MQPDRYDLAEVLWPPTPFPLREHALLIGPWDVVLYSLQKFVSLLLKQNPNAVMMLWLRPEDYLYLAPEGRELLAARDLFRERRRAYDAFVGYAKDQLHRMTAIGAYRGYMGAKRKTLVDRFGYDCKNAQELGAHREDADEVRRSGRMTVYREHDRERLLEIKTGKWPLEEVKLLAERMFADCERALAESVLPEQIDAAAVTELVVTLTRRRLGREG